MDTSKDPECGCAICTTFEGQVEGDVIEGTFTARPGHGPPYKGTWMVERKRKGGFAGSDLLELCLTRP